MILEMGGSREPLLNPLDRLEEKRDETPEPIVIPAKLKLDFSKVQSILRESGIEPSEVKSITSQLDKADLKSSDIFEVVGRIMRSSDNDGVRLQAAKIALQLRGLLNDDVAKPVPVFQFIIKDATFRGGINPILVPREDSV